MKITRSFLLVALLFTSNAIQHAKGDIIAVEPDGKVSFNPPFPMSHQEDPSAGLPITSVTYSGDNAQNTNGTAQVSFIGTTALWMVQNPGSFTNRVTTISDLKRLIDTNVDKGPGGTNMDETIMKFQGQDALETSGFLGGLWHDQIMMYWGKPNKWNDNAIFVVDARATKKDICKALVKAVKVDPPKE